MAKINRCGLKYFVLKMNGKDKQLFEEISRLKKQQKTLCIKTRSEINRKEKHLCNKKNLV